MLINGTVETSVLLPTKRSFDRIASLVDDKYSQGLGNQHQICSRAFQPLGWLDKYFYLFTITFITL